MLRTTPWLLCLCLAVLCGVEGNQAALGAEPVLWEVQVGKQTLIGKPEAHNARECWLTLRDGSLRHFYFKDLKGFKKTTTPFRKYTATELSRSLRSEFGRDFEIVTSENFAVAAPQGKARQYSARFEQTYREFRLYFGTRGFRLDRLEFPLIAVIYPNEADFRAQAKKDGIAASSQVAGYYHPLSNRVLLFEPSASSKRGKSLKAGLSIEDVIIHEATHQIAFNRGLHARFGENPKWIVEGIATVFEAPGIRGSTSDGEIRTRINPHRLAVFSGTSQQPFPKGTVRQLIRGDELFVNSPSEAYARAWALSFYLIERRSWDFSRYLKRVAARKTKGPYSADEREADFRQVFGRNHDRLEADINALLRELQQGRKGVAKR